MSRTPQNRKDIKTATDLRKQFRLAGVALRWWAGHEDWCGRVGKQVSCYAASEMRQR
jgi:hypothetical protein